jgi:hypothetical protein
MREQSLGSSVRVRHPPVGPGGSQGHVEDGEPATTGELGQVWGGWRVLMGVKAIY